MDIRASNNIVHIWTCSDSCYALMELINYLGRDGDFSGSCDAKEPSRAETPVSVVRNVVVLLYLRYFLAFFLRYPVFFTMLGNICVCE